MTLYDKPFDLINYGKREIQYMNVESSRQITDSSTSYRFAEGTKELRLLKLFTLSLSNESNQYTRRRMKYIDVLSEVGGLAKVVFFMFGAMYIFFGRYANQLHLAIMY